MTDAHLLSALRELTEALHWEQRAEYGSRRSVRTFRKYADKYRQEAARSYSLHARTMCGYKGAEDAIYG